ncbi:MAG: FAD-dependent oxidoreductase [Alphaproteobacteria bacterium]|nr:FAD-dependent oxidoreductase [Alphaproteobacteria bacterium]
MKQNDLKINTPEINHADSSKIILDFGLNFSDLYNRDGLITLDGHFVGYLKEYNLVLANRFLEARAKIETLPTLEESQLLIEVAPYLEDFIGKLFHIETELKTLSLSIQNLSPLYQCKRQFVQRQAVKAFTQEQAEQLDGKKLREELIPYLGIDFSELAFAIQVEEWEKGGEENNEKLDLARRYAAWATLSKDGQAQHKTGILFKQPHKINPHHLVPVETIVRDGVTMMRLPEEHWRARQDFNLTDPGYDLPQALDQMNYCIWCHNQGKDSCSKGLKDRKNGGFQKSAFNITLAGCPLEEKISEMHTLKAQGHSLGAFAIIAIDNPMMAATGHRICNDCMKACIYQKQEPVDIPQAETRIFKDILELPWGFEIYSLLTKWNPLNLRRPLPKGDSHYKILVVGLGPSGFTLAHHLLNEGHNIVAIDGLKIEPLPHHISGIDLMGKRHNFIPIRDVKELYENLDERVTAGFGGVAEYGITVRWNKNFLKLIRLLLERRSHFTMYGGVRFGGTLTVESAMAMGFDHIALCAGAGKPTYINIPNGLARGVRMASDFLMSLQLTGAAKNESIANLQLRLPIVVIGGGLTAIDTATESLTYYSRQVEKFLNRYESLLSEKTEQMIRADWNEEECLIADEFIKHAKALRAENARAALIKEKPKIAELLNSWGGATVAYRRRLIDAPSYTLNHEEVAKALEEGISFAENMNPVSIDIDQWGHAQSITFQQTLDQKNITLPARSILVAAGTQPNTVLAEEDPDFVKMDGKYFQAIDTYNNPVTPTKSLAKPEQAEILMSCLNDGRFMSFFGDMHPSFFGNVVKAMASAKQGYPLINQVLIRKSPTSVTYKDLVKKLDHDLRAFVHKVQRLTPTIIEVIIKAPLAAAHFQPGQFYRLQNYESLSLRTSDTVLAMEGLAMTGAWTNKEQGLISVIALEMGGSSDLCTLLKPDEPVVLMGPTGAPTDIVSNETVILVGGGLGNAVLFSIGAALKAAGSKVIYFAGYRKKEDRYKVDQIEAAADVVIWCCDEQPGFSLDRPQDKSFVGNIVEGIRAYGEGKLGSVSLSLKEASRMVVIGSDRMMAALAKARHTILKPYLNPEHIGIGSINSPMQCMMKEICAQCLQTHIDPVTGKETIVFSCFNQDQNLDYVDWQILNQRLKQNSLQEKLTKQWIDRCLQQLSLRSYAA